MDFFSECKDDEEAKTLYRKLCKCFHPDRGGDAELLMKAIHQYNDFNINHDKPTSPVKQTEDDFVFSSFDNARYIQIQALRNKLFKLESEMKTLQYLIDMQTKALQVQKNQIQELEKELSFYQKATLWQFFLKRYG